MTITTYPHSSHIVLERREPPRYTSGPQADSGTRYSHHRPDDGPSSHRYSTPVVREILSPLRHNAHRASVW